MQIPDLPTWEIAAGDPSKKIVTNYTRDIKFRTRQPHANIPIGRVLEIQGYEKSTNGSGLYENPKNIGSSGTKVIDMLGTKLQFC